MKDGTVEFTVKKIADTNSIDSLNQKLATKQDILEDTGWVTITDIHDGYTVRNPYTPKIRRIGKTVFLEGQFLQKTTDNSTVCVLPKDFRPSREVTVSNITSTWIRSDTGEVRTNYNFIEHDNLALQINCSWAVD